MSVIDLKTGLHHLIDEEQDAQILAAVYQLLYKQRQDDGDFWHRLSDEQKADIQTGLADLDAGRTVPAADVFARYY
jgi:predicted transcriptional regulator